MHGAATTLLSAAMVVIGFAMVATTVARGGGPLTAGVILGLLFAVAGAGRLYAARSARR